MIRLKARRNWLIKQQFHINMKHQANTHSSIFIKAYLSATILSILSVLILAVILLSKTRSYFLGEDTKSPLAILAKSIAEYPSALKRSINSLFSDSETSDPFLVESFNLNSAGGWQFSAKGFKENLGYLLLSKYDGDLKRSTIELWDMKQKRLLCTYPDPPIEDLWARTKLKSIVDFRTDSSRHRLQLYAPLMLSDGSLLSQGYSPLIKYDSNSKTWKIFNDDLLYHHSIEQDSDGFIWVPYRDEAFNKQYSISSRYWIDGIAKLDKSGRLLYKENLYNIFKTNKLDFLITSRGVIPEDPYHLNDIQPVLKSTQYWKKGDLFLSIRNLSLIALYRPSTKRIIWYKQDGFIHQHDISITSPSKILLFDNNAPSSFSSNKLKFQVNSIISYDFATNTSTKVSPDLFSRHLISTATAGRVLSLPNNNFFIEESAKGRIFYFNAKDNISPLAIYNNISKNKRLRYVLNWSRPLPYDTFSKIRRSPDAC